MGLERGDTSETSAYGCGLGGMERPTCPSDLSDREWQLLKPLLPPPKPGGRPTTCPRREIVNAIRYALRTGCSWRMLPHDRSPWRIVCHCFRTWRKDGAWQRANCAWRCDSPRVVRPAPARLLLTAHRADHGKRGPWGYDAGQQVTGRKRHVVVDTLGLRLAVAVHPADIQSRPRAATRGRDGAKLALTQLLGRFPRLQLSWADGAYGGKLAEWARTVGSWTLELARRPAQQHAFQVLPRRCVVERAFGWLNRQRRLSKDYEAPCETTETWIYIAMTGLLLRRLAHLSHF